MLKFVVVLYKRPDFAEEQFAKYMCEVHGPMAERLPGLTGYVQNFPLQDPKRKHPGWNAVICAAGIVSSSVYSDGDSIR